MTTPEQLERKLRVLKREQRKLKSRLARQAMEDRQAIVAAAKPKRADPCVVCHRVYDKFSWPVFCKVFVASSDWRPTDSATLKLVRQANWQAKLG